MLARRPGLLAGAAAAFLAALLCVSGAFAAPARAPAPIQVGGPFAAPQPNIVFVLTDDLSWDLLPYMANVKRLRERGTTFTNYFVTDSLCCPSRASILTGQYPHNTGIFRNTGADGGFLAFHAKGLEQQTYATALQGAGYRTALMGKYLNQYAPERIRTALGGPFIPPGWTDWVVSGNGYPGFGYRLSRNVRLVRHGYRAKDYLTNVLAREGLDFVDDAVAEGSPFMLNVWTFAPHSPATPAPQDRNRFAAVTAPRDASFDEADMLDKPAWLRDHRPLTLREVERIDQTFRQRVRAVQAVDRLLGRLQRRLRAAGVARNTYVVFSSDNGFHQGQHRLAPGKLTAYDPDIRVPLVVAGPGVPAARTVDAMTENTDLCPTFAELAGATVPPTADGRSLVPLLRGQGAGDWRDAVLIEHRGNVSGANDPDLPPAGSGNPPTYEALRSKDALYVEYADGERELYDLASDPFQLRNIAREAAPERLARLSGALATMKNCHGPAQCWDAGQLD
jgi:N-acetylglucosamine-6-sulfatase